MTLETLIDQAESKTEQKENSLKKETEVAESTQKVKVFKIIFARGAKPPDSIKKTLKKMEGVRYDNRCHKSYLCSPKAKGAVESLLKKNNIEFKFEETVDFSPPANKKINAIENQIEYLENDIKERYGNLRTEVYGYDSRKNLIDFEKVPKIEDFPEGESDEKKQSRLEIETGLHQKLQEINEKEQELHNLRISKNLEQEDLNACNEEKIILSAKSPLVSARRLTEDNFKHNGLRTIHFCGDAFWQWTGPCYEELRHNHVRKIIYDFLDTAYVEKIDQDIISHAKFDPNQAKVNNVLDAFKATCECGLIPESGASWINSKNKPLVENLIVFKNGILDVEVWLKDKTAKLMTHTPLLMNAGYLPFDFEPNYQSPIEWLSFLNSIWPNDQQCIDTLQEWFGYNLTKNTSFHKILLIVGPPRSGKGTIGRIMRALLGERNVVGPTLSSLSGDFGLQPWLNKSLAIISDARLSGKSENNIIIERLLSTSGEDPLTIQRKHRDPITTTLPTRIMIMTNELPDLRDTSGAIVNRYIILPMLKSWLGAEDLDLENRIRKELSQILVWSLEGLKRLKERKRFVQPESARQHCDDLMSMSSPIKAFINDRCELGPHKYIEVEALFKEWEKWCKDTGHDRPGTKQVFGRNLSAVGISSKQIRKGVDRESRDKTDRMRIYEGIGLAILPN